MVVDYAHTPAGLEVALAAARDLAGGRSGDLRVRVRGDRDRASGRRWARSALAVADVVVLTSDNPRSEDPVAIIDQVRSGGSATAAEVVVEPDRAEAIATAIGLARSGDVVVIAGKGHETTQTIGATGSFPSTTGPRPGEALAARSAGTGGAGGR